MSGHATRQIAPRAESTARLVLTSRDPTRREDFSFGASRERHRRCLLRSAMDRPRKRARGPAPTRPFANFASPRVLNLATRVPKRASPSPAPRAPVHAAPSGVAYAVALKIKRVAQAYPESERKPASESFSFWRDSTWIPNRIKRARRSGFSVSKVSEKDRERRPTYADSV
jgi:hypothetical protein